MSEHYYNQNPSSLHDERVIQTQFFNKVFHFKTDAGVFSKKRVDFGTTLLLDSIDFPKAAKVLDLGCGYGPVGIVTASILEKGSVSLVDINERAINLAKTNLQMNRKHINENIQLDIFQSDGFQNVKVSDFDLIILNPPIRAGKDLVHQLFEESYMHLKDGGELWVVIQKKQGAPSAIKKLETVFSSVEEVEKKKGYFIIRSKKISKF